MLILLIVLVSPVEILVLELLLQAFLPLLWLRLLVLFLEVYGLFWFLGFYASRITLPHRLEENGVRVRHGTFAEGFIPYFAIENAGRKYRKSSRSGDGLDIDDEEAFFAIAGHTDITFALYAPQPLNGFLRPTRLVDTIHFAVDTPEQFLEDLKGRIELFSTDNKKASKT